MQEQLVNLKPIEKVFLLNSLKCYDNGVIYQETKGNGLNTAITLIEKELLVFMDKYSKDRNFRYFHFTQIGMKLALQLERQ